ncbi:hypothetical protein AAVH_08210 [Aphelenchoides avenae]|nr:hypothetical protein AAVH_08210 [Aphelenchus avenae]
MKFTDILYTERLELKVQDLSKEVSTLHAQNDLLEKNSGHVSELEKRIAVLEETNKQQAMQVEVLRGIIERPAEVHTSKRMPRVISNSIRINRCCSRTNATRIWWFPGVHSDYNTAPHGYAQEANDGQRAGSHANLTGPHSNPLPPIDDLLQAKRTGQRIACTDRYCSGVVVQQNAAADSAEAGVEAQMQAAADQPGTSDVHEILRLSEAVQKYVYYC